jgi:hypothetical protein
MDLSPVLLTAQHNIERENLTCEAAAQAEECKKKCLAIQIKAANHECNHLNKSNGTCASF